MIYNAEIMAGLIKEVSKVYENNAGLNIHRDIERLKDFAKAMGHNILEEQTSKFNVSLSTLCRAFSVAISEYELLVKNYFALVGGIKLIYLCTDKGYVATTINGQYPFYFEDDGVVKAYAQDSIGEFVQCYTNQSYMWQHELPYIILFVNSISNVTDITGTDRGVDITYKTYGGGERTHMLSVRFDYRTKVIKGKESKRGISFKNAMERGSMRVAKWMYHNEVRKGA